MSDIHPGAVSMENDKGARLVAEARSSRRKMLLWRRAGLLALSMAVIVTIVMWQRMTIRTKECEDALLHYAELAKNTNLALGPEETFESRWEHMSRGSETFPPGHFVPIPQSWRQSPAPGQPPLPLAICRESHLVRFARGRHLLYLDDKGMHVIWLSEEQAAPILQRIRPNNP
jgi:hypothetical protein